MGVITKLEMAAQPHRGDMCQRELETGGGGMVILSMKCAVYQLTEYNDRFSVTQTLCSNIMLERVVV